MRTKLNRTEQNETEQNRKEEIITNKQKTKIKNRIKKQQNRTKQNRIICLPKEA